MRLIDADELLKYMETTEIRQSIDELNKGNDNYSSTALYVYIKEMPTAYNVDKVVERLEGLNKAEQSRAAAYDESGRLDLMDIHDAKAEAYISSIRIVKSGGIE